MTLALPGQDNAGCKLGQCYTSKRLSGVLQAFALTLEETFCSSGFESVPEMDFRVHGAELVATAKIDAPSLLVRPDTEFCTLAPELLQITVNWSLAFAV